MRSRGTARSAHAPADEAPLASADPVVRVCTNERVRDRIVQRILDGSYQAGMRLKELDLAAEFGTSQAPVREALRELQASGLVTSERFRGCRVREIDRAELREAYELRALLEERSVDLAMPMSSTSLKLLKRELALMRSGITHRDRETHATAAVRFHRQLVLLSRNRSFVVAWDSLIWEIRARIALRRARLSFAELERILTMHEELIELLRKREAAAARRKVREIVERIAAQL